MRTRLAVLAICCVTFGIPDALGQDQVRKFDQPILVTSTGGHAAPVRRLIFPEEGTELLSAGMDKIVNIWSLGPGRPSLSRTIRPVIWRGPRGSIYALALSPVDKVNPRLLAVAGYGVEDPKGNIALYRYPGRADVPTGDIVAQLPSGDAREPDPRRRLGHVNTVTELAFARGGSLLASASNDATIRIWDVATRTTRAVLVDHVGAVNALAFSPDGLRFVTGGVDGILRVWDVNTGALLLRKPPPPRPVAEAAGEIILCLAVSPDGTSVVIGRENGQLERYNLADLAGPVLLPTRNNQGPIESLALSRDGRRLVTGIVSQRLQNSSDYPRVACDIELRRYPGGEVETPLFAAYNPVPNPLSNLSYACAFGPNDRFLAVSGGDTQGIHLFDLNDRGRPAIELKGQGESIWDVGWRADGRAVGFGRRLPDAPGSPTTYEGFDFTDASRPEFDRPTLDRAEKTWEGWTVRPVRPLELDVVNPQGVIAYRITLHPEEDRRWWSYTFLPPREGHQKPMLAVGCEGGIALYEATTGRRLRFLAGHLDKVYALAPSRDGRWLASGSSDQTVRLWRLQGCDTVPPFGARFERNPAGTWVVIVVEPRGFAEAMGLQVKDEVQSALVGTETLDLRAGLGRLDTELAGVPLVLRVTRQGQLRSIGTTKRDGPALSLFPGRDGEWVAWMPDGHYDTSIGGDRRHLGWHVNPTQTEGAPAILDRPTDHFAVDRFEARLYRPLAIRRLVETGDPVVALAEANLPPAVPAPPAVDVAATVEDSPPPTLRVLRPVLVPGRPYAIQAGEPAIQIRATGKGTSRVRSLRVLVDGRQASENTFDPGSAEVTSEIPWPTAGGRHQIELVATNDRGIPTSLGFEAISPSAPTRQPRLVVVSIGSNRFAKGLPAVDLAGRDALDMKDYLLAPRGKSTFPITEGRALSTPEEATAYRMREALDGLESERAGGRLGPGDAVFLSLETHFLTDGKSDWIAASDTGEESSAAPALPASEVAERLGRLTASGCRVVLMMDGVHRPTSREKTDRFKAWVRDLYKKRNVVAFIASKQGPSLAFNKHRAFAEGVLTSLEVGGRQRLWIDPSRRVSVQEFRTALIDRVSELTRDRQFADGYLPEAVPGGSPFFDPATTPSGE